MFHYLPRQKLTYQQMVSKTLRRTNQCFALSWWKQATATEKVSTCLYLSRYDNRLAVHTILIPVTVFSRHWKIAL